MSRTDRTQERAMLALLNAITEVPEHPKTPANFVLAKAAVDAIAQHAIAVAQAGQAPDPIVDAIDHPDG
ncbi:hypothetical protein LCGC14_1947640 [marine sediment metagenome]|uniref:Uncharacterized protein n=1 Tax=marine sediment metagenome TaxID=412755 RepID=A0A0F9G6U8_9ZZZZ